MKKYLLDRHVLGRVVAYTCVTENQKKGLPHIHIFKKNIMYTLAYTTDSGRLVTNQSTVPTNAALLMKYDCHINVQICISFKQSNIK